MTYTKQQQEWKAKGLCVGCGGIIDNPAYYVKCQACRTAWTEKTREYRMARKAERKAKQMQAALESAAKFAEMASLTPNQIWAHKKIAQEKQKLSKAERLKRQIDKCLYCEWVRIEDGIAFCPFPKGICAKGVYSRGQEE